MSGGFIGRGRIHLAPYSTTSTFWERPYRFVGNTSKFELSASEQTLEVPDYTSGIGGTADSYSRVDKVTLGFDLREFTAANIALAVWGAASAASVAAVTDEAGYKLRLGAFIPTRSLIDLAQPVTVKKGATAIPATSGADTNWVASAGGITFSAALTGAAGVVDGDAITLSYTPQAHDKVEALIQAAPEVSIYFDGQNARTGKPMVGGIHRVKLGILGGLGLITDEFGTLSLSATVQADDTVAGAGLSQYFFLRSTS